MKTTITQISNIFNLLSQIDVRIFNYHHGYRYDINQNIANNFDPSNDTGRLFPAVMFDIPDNVKYLDQIDYLDVREEIQVTLYFDDLQGYNNDGSQNILNPVEQWQRLKQISEDFIANFRYLFEDKYGAGVVGLPTFVQRANLYNEKIITWEVSFQLTHAIPCTDEQYKIDPADFPDTLDEDDLERTTGTPPTACDRIISQLNDTLLLTCVLPLYNFAQVATQNALSVQQILDLKTWLLPQYDFSDSVWQNLLTTQQELDLVDYLLPTVDFTDLAIQNLLSTQQKDDILEWLFPLLDFTAPSAQALVTPQQQEDLTNWLCPAPQRASFVFDGIGEYFQSVYNAAHEIERTDRFTIFAWIKVSAYSNAGICSKFTSGANRKGYYLKLLADGKIEFVLRGDHSTNIMSVTSTTSVLLNSWNFVAVTYDGSSLNTGFQVYNNGALLSVTRAGIIAISSINATEVFRIAHGASGFYSSFSGKIALVGLIKGATLSLSEIQSLQAIPYPQSTIYEANQVVWVDFASSLWYSTDWYAENKADGNTNTAFKSVLMEYADKDFIDYPI